MRNNKILISADELSLYIFCSLVLFYGAFGYPFPKGLGIFEACLGVGLVTLVFYNNFGITESQNGKRFLWFFCIVMLIFPVLVGVARGAFFVDIIRDFFPFLYFSIFIFVGKSFFNMIADRLLVIMFVLYAAGVLMSVRYFYLTEDISLYDIGRVSFKNFTFLNYDPLVTFSVVYSVWYMFQSYSIQSKFFILLGGVVAFLSLAGVLQRAPLGLVFIYIILVLLWNRSYISIALLAGLALFNIDVIFDQFSAVIEKQAEVGADGKILELKMILTLATDNVLVFLIGHGWGSLYNNPALLGEEVSFTHSFISYIFFKMGFLGLFFYMFLFFTVFFRVARKNNILVVGCFVIPIVVPFLFQVTYKSFGFAMLFLVLYSLANTNRRGL